MSTDKLNKAIKLHQLHMANPKLATEKSQQVMMDLMMQQKMEMQAKAKKMLMS